MEKTASSKKRQKATPPIRLDAYVEALLETYADSQGISVEEARAQWIKHNEFLRMVCLSEELGIPFKSNALDFEAIAYALARKYLPSFKVIKAPIKKGRPAKWDKANDFILWTHVTGCMMQQGKRKTDACRFLVKRISMYQGMKYNALLRRFNDIDKNNPQVQHYKDYLAANKKTGNNS